MESELTTVFYTKDRPEAILEAVTTLDQSVNSHPPVMVIEDAPVRKNRDFWKGDQRPNFNFLEIPQKSSCARLMNLGIVLANTRYVMLCNDDLVFHKGWDQVADKYIKQRYEVILLYNFGAVIIDRACISRLGYFDEGFLGGNREDQDMMLRLLLQEGTDQEVRHINTWDETGDKLIGHKPIYYGNASWDGRQNEVYFKEKWGTIDYGRLIKETRAKAQYPAWKETDWYPAATKRLKALYGETQV